MTVPNGYTGSTVEIRLLGERRQDGTIRLETTEGLTRWTRRDEPCLACGAGVGQHLRSLEGWPICPGALLDRRALWYSLYYA